MMYAFNRNLVTKLNIHKDNGSFGNKFVWGNCTKQTN